jgi:hypothetical protein
MSQATNRNLMPLPAAINRLAVELRVLGQSLRAVEHAVDILFSPDAPGRNTAIENLQTIDILGQTLASLADFADRLAVEVPTQVVVDIDRATGGIPLAALAGRLQANAATGSNDATAADEDIVYF